MNEEGFLRVTTPAEEAARQAVAFGPFVGWMLLALLVCVGSLGLLERWWRRGPR